VNITPNTAQGVPLNTQWAQQAPLKAKQAADDYLHRLQNAWKGSLTKSNNSETINARLTKDSAGISGETRVDSLRLVVDNQEEEVWIGKGVTVRKKRKFG